MTKRPSRWPSVFVGLTQPSPKGWALQTDGALPLNQICDLQYVPASGSQFVENSLNEPSSNIATFWHS